MSNTLKMKLKILTGKWYWNSDKRIAKEDLNEKRIQLERELKLVSELLIELN